MQGIIYEEASVLTFLFVTIVLGGLDAASAGVPVVDSIVGGLSYALQYLAMCVLLILSLVKSGSWARDILGG